MAHSESRADPLREFLLGVVGGGLYGASHTVSGHPLDTLKARMQLDKKFYGLSTPRAAALLWAEGGPRGFLRGFFPPLFGSVVYRSAMLSTYEAATTWFLKNTEIDSVWHMEIAGGYFPRPLVLASALCSSAARSVVESPFEYAKVMRQTGRSWVMSDCFRGFAAQTTRTTAMLMFIMGPFDVVKTKTKLLQTYGPFAVVTGICGCSYAIIHPLESLKNMAQAGLPHPGASVAQRVAHIGGPLALYRGALPGITSGALRNGVAMATMLYWQKYATALGLRD